MYEENVDKHPTTILCLYIVALIKMTVLKRVRKYIFS